VIVTRGNDEVGIAAGTLECDAALFEARLDQGSPESAWELYGDPFFDGLHVSEADLERWIEDERARYRRLAVEAAGGMADRDEQRGDLHAAVAWARKAVETEPHSEVGIRRLIGLLGRAGERDAAVRVYAGFAARLAEELDLEPSEETRALADAVRSSPGASAVEVAGSSIDVPAAGGVDSVRVTPARRTHPGLPYITSLSLAAVIVVAALWGWLRPAPAEPPLRYSMTFATGEEMAAMAGRRFALSPDRTILVYVSGPPGRLRVRRRDQLRSTELPGTERARSPFFSPDGARVGLFSDGALKIAPLEGGPILVVTDVLDWTGGASWGPDGFVYAALPAFSGLVRLRPEPGAVPHPFTELDPINRESDHKYPDVLPSGDGVLFTVDHASVTGSTKSIGLADLETGSHKLLVEGIYARYAASGHLVYVAPDSTLMVAPLDPEALELTGPSRVVSPKQRVGFRGAVDLAVSVAGTLVYATGPGEGLRELVWVSRDGAVESLDSSWQGGLGWPTLSPDGSRLAVVMTSANGADVWIRDMETGATLKLTGEGSSNGYPSWTPDGRSVTYVSNAGGSAELWTKPADGSAHAMLELSRPRDLAESFWSPDGQWLIYRTSNVLRAAPGMPSEGAADILAIRPDAGEEPISLATTEFTEVCPTLSPDGRWLAYASHETGKEAVFVVPFPNTGDAKWAASPDGGMEPVWSHDGNELFYRDLQGTMRVVQVQTTPSFSVGRTIGVFDGRGFVVSGLHPMYAVSPDDRRFLMVRRTTEADPGELIVVENWFQELKSGR